MKKVSSALIIDKKNNILLQHRDAGAPTHPNRWGLWGGAVEDGETHIEAVCRELKEEIDISVTEDNLSLFKTYKSEEFGLEGYVYILEHKEDFKYTVLEGDDMQFFSKDEMKDLRITPFTKVVSNDYFEQHSSSPFI